MHREATSWAPAPSPGRSAGGEAIERAAYAANFDVVRQVLLDDPIGVVVMTVN